MSGRAELQDAPAADERLEEDSSDLGTTRTNWSRSRHNIGWAIALSALAAGSAIALRSGILQDSSNAVEAVAVAPAIPVQTVSVEPVSAYQTVREYTGDIEARRTSEVGFERAGTLVAIAVDEGDSVAAGTEIARLDARNFTARRRELEAQRAQARAVLMELEAGPRVEDIAAAEANVRDLEAQLDLARSRNQRRADLFREGAISRENLDETASSEAALEARLQAAKSGLEELEAGTRREQILAQEAAVQQLDARIASVDVDLAKSIVRAPFSGRISTRHVDEGAVTGAGQPIVSVMEGGTVEARIGVPANAIASLSTGSRQQVTVGDRRYEATVKAILPALDESTRTVTAVLTLEPGAIASPGEIARLALTEMVPTSGYWLPTAALVQGERGLWSSYAIASVSNTPSTTPAASPTANEYVVEERSLEVLHVDGSRALVRGTLQPGDRAISGGIHRIVPGQRVRLADVN
ncbi:MAG: HlyD family efflux transporter periplasmic adaptor subunit [Cyanobacteria bacterium J06639_1]